MLLTLPELLVRNSFLTFILNATSLLSMVSDNQVEDWESSFLDKENWKKVIVTYRGEGGQFIPVTFKITDPEEVTFQGLMFANQKARQEFQIATVTIYDYQNGKRSYSRAQIPSAESMDIVFANTEATAEILSLFGPSYVMMTKDATNPELMYVTGDFNALTEGKQYQFPAINVADITIDQSISSVLVDPRTEDYYFKADGTKIYAIGCYEDRYYKTALPPRQFNTGNPNLLRIVEIDIATSSVTHLCDLDRSYVLDDNGLTATFGSVARAFMVEDGVCYVRGQSYMGAFNIADGTKVWLRNHSVGNHGYITLQQASIMKKVGTQIYFQVQTYESVSVGANPEIIRVDAATGIRDNTLPVMNSSWQLKWEMSPDQTKIVAIHANYGVKYIDLSAPTPAWSTFNLDVDGGCVLVENSYFLLHGTIVNSPSYNQAGAPILKFNFSGNYVSTMVSGTNLSSAGFARQYSEIAKDNTDVYVFCGGFRKFNQTTGVEDTVLVNKLINHPQSGAIQRMKFELNGKLVFKSGFSSYAFMYDYNAPITSAPMMVVNTATKALINSASISNIYSSGGGLKVPFFTHSLYPNRFIALMNSDNFRVYNSTTLAAVPAETSLWPSRAGMGAGWSVPHIDGNFVYIGAANGENFNMTDSDGAFNTVQYEMLIRVNLTTKKIDRTFVPNLQSLGISNSSQVYMCSTTDYIYMTWFCYTGTKVIRMKKSDNSFESITSAMLNNGSNPGHGNYEYRFEEIGGGKIVGWAQRFSGSLTSGANRLADKVYAIYDEATFAYEASQTTHNECPVSFVYNNSDKSLCGVSYDPDTGKYSFVKYIVNTHAKTKYDDLAGTYPTSFNPTAVINNFVFDGTDYYTYLKDYYQGDLYAGVVKMNPFAFLAE